MKDSGKFVDAGLIYNQVSGMTVLKEYPEQLLKIIDNSIICLLLSSNTPKRIRLLNNLYQD